MTEPTPLTLAFLAQAPQSAAQVLEELRAADAAAFLGQVPARIAAPAVGYMSSWNAARCIAMLTPEHAAAVLGNLHFHDSAGLVRLISAARREAVLEALPGRLARRLRKVLTWPAGSVGAWIDPEIPAFADTATVADAARYLAGAPPASHIFIHVADDGRFAGAVPAAALIRTEQTRPLAEVARLEVRPLSSRATLASVAFLEAWDEFLMLPVVGRNRCLVGGLSRAGLRKGLHESRNVPEKIPGTLTGHLLSAFAASCAGLLRVATNSEPGDTRDA